ncbi:MAG: alpha/beta hydrolase [Anaerolineales bacterium]|nr:alpha/beta hydrolase [Anaerolineales bacterium]
MPLFLIITLTLFIVLIAYLIPRYQREKREAIRRFRAVGEVMQTANGPVEYAVVGEGYPVLVLHGTGGGCEQGLLVGRLLGAEKLKIIAVTRAGYRRTPLTTGLSFEEQADAALDALKIERAAVISISGGGPSAMQFALRHPDRCLALVLLSAHGPGTLQAFSARTFAFVARLIGVMVVDFPFWMMSHAPVRWPLFLLGEKVDNLRDVSKLEVAQAILDGMFPPSDYKAGLMNDMTQVLKLPNQPDWPLGNLKVPTLILHGTRDVIVRFGAAKFHAEHIPGARLIPYKGGTHLIASTHRQEVGQAMAEFVLTKLAQSVIQGGEGKEVK